MAASWSTDLKTEISRRARELANQEGLPYYLSLGPEPTVMFEAFDNDQRHGNFIGASYDRILVTPNWRARLDKPHPRRKALPMPQGAAAKELDSSNSSDALLMNTMCHPDSDGLRALLGAKNPGGAVFGVPGKIPLLDGSVDQTELDMVWDDLIVESKLTEPDFKSKRAEVVTRYSRLGEVFWIGRLPQTHGLFTTYQLIRNILASVHHGQRFFLLCDIRRPDLMEDYERTISAVRLDDHRAACRLKTWQEIASTAEPELANYLVAKYGITPLNQ